MAINRANSSSNDHTYIWKLTVQRVQAMNDHTYIWKLTVQRVQVMTTHISGY